MLSGVLSPRSAPSRDPQPARSDAPTRGPGSVRRWMRSPARLITAGTAMILTAGTAALMMPFTRIGEHAPPLVDALFTAASALCVTGLITVDTATYWSPAGQLVIMVLIQIGGLGVMTLSTLLAVLTVRRIGVRTRAAIAQSSAGTLQDAPAIIGRILAISFAVEAVIAAVLVVRYLLDGMSAGTALFRGAFLAVSAFNNAGFALDSDSLIGENSDPFILAPVMVAVVLGGIGFPVIVEMLRRFRTPRRWSLTTKLTLTGTAVLLGAGTVLTLALESSNSATLGSMSWGDRLWNAVFHSVVSRTAGFNAIDTSAMRPESWLGTDVLMMIGGGSGGTAGGMKVTTVMVLLLIIRSELRGDPFVVAFGKRLSRAVHREVITVVGLMGALVAVSTFVVMVLESIPFDRVLFEVTSALSTTGLSTGITADLSPVSKILLVGLMIIGRVGPITLGTALALRRRPLLFEPPKERPTIG
ncbi:ATPase [Brachybacterium phenoliresistens]|uniref:ATPase n=1 Tax=Brachybacterium phenoliresistens TaxID=396014 RepID=Z9JT95_9MICO|nr:ATPase [Brachybacterium phenoliresistens]